MVGGDILSSFPNIYNTFVSAIPEEFRTFISLFFIILTLVIYGVFVWKFKGFISQKNLIDLNLSKYNESEHPLFGKLFALGLYFLEYIIILPIFVFMWFFVLTVFLILLTQGLKVETILIIAASIVGAVRITSYIPKYGEKLADEIAKILPITLLGTTLTASGFFEFSGVVNHLSQIPGVMSKILYYLGFIVFIELLLRLFDFLFSFLEGGSEGIEKSDSKSKKEFEEE